MFLRTCFKAAMEQPEGTTVILGGDMNLRVSALLLILCIRCEFMMVCWH